MRRRHVQLSTSTTPVLLEYIIANNRTTLRRMPSNDFIWERRRAGWRQIDAGRLISHRSACFAFLPNRARAFCHLSVCAGREKHSLSFWLTFLLTGSIAANTCWSSESASAAYQSEQSVISSPKLSITNSALLLPSTDFINLTPLSCKSCERGSCVVSIHHKMMNLQKTLIAWNDIFYLILPVNVLGRNPLIHLMFIWAMAKSQKCTQTMDTF